MGPRGCVTYTPALVLRQLHWTQTKPQEEQLGGYSFQYQKDGSTKEQEGKVRVAWKNIKNIGENELGRQRLTSSLEYQEWRTTRRVQTGAPKKFSNHEGPSQEASQAISQMASQLEITKAQMGYLEEGKEAAELKVIILQDRCQKMAKKIEYLKDECTNATKVAKTRKGKEKISEDHLARTQKLEEEIQALLKERDGLRMEVNRRDQDKEKLEVKVNKERRAKEKLEMQLNKERRVRGIEVNKEKHAREELEEKVENLLAALAQAENDCTHGWSSSNQYQNLFIEAANVAKFWREQALDQETELKEWKEKYAKITGELSHYIPNLVRRFEKADEQVHMMPLLNLPPEVIDFMNACGSFARGLKRKKTRLLM